MNLHALILQPVREHCTIGRRLCSAPFGKGGYGGFAFDLRQQQWQEQEQIPLNPPFSKGEATARLRQQHGRGFCSAPFEKGGYGGFAFAFAFEHQQQPEQKQIPLNPPFAKGEAGLRAAEGGPVLS
ncbi:MAG TPA: hypothetical protein VF471_17025 [Pseudoxanthomonas sp.]